MLGSAPSKWRFDQNMAGGGVEGFKAGVKACELHSAENEVNYSVQIISTEN